MHFFSKSEPNVVALGKSISSRLLLALALVAGLPLLAACGGGGGGSSPVVLENPESTDDPTDPPVVDPPVVVPASAMDFSIESGLTNSVDGAASVATIYATVFVPEHNEGESFPLIVHSHGWGGSRFSVADAEALDPAPADTDASYFDLVDRQVETLWNAGYAVISFDERGFGGTAVGASASDDGDPASGDGAHGMSVQHEIQDAIAIIDWAVENAESGELLADLAFDDAGRLDPKIGTLGGSYGGGFQLMLAAIDERVDVLVPSATWFNFEESLLTNGAIKKAYGHGLCLLAQTDGANLAPEVAQACQEGSTVITNREAADASQASQDVFINNSLKTVSETPGFTMPQVDALLLQGTRDILFNLGQAVQSYNFLTAAGGDVRLMSHEDGHGVRELRSGPGSQPELGDAFCGSVDAIVNIVNWFDEKLKGISDAANMYPRICLSLDDSQGVTVSGAPVPRGDDGSLTNLVATIDDGAGAPLALSGNDHHNRNGIVEEPSVQFISAGTVADDSRVLAGVPTANLTIAAGITNTDPTVASGPVAALFIGVGIKRGSDFILIDDQVQPILTPFDGAIDLVAVAEDLQAGDEVGVLVYGQFDIYEGSIACVTDASGNNCGSNWLGNAVTVQGTVNLPIFDAVPDVRAP